MFGKINGTMKLYLVCCCGPRCGLVFCFAEKGMPIHEDLTNAIHILFHMTAMQC